MTDRPTKADIDRLIAEGEAWQHKIDELVTVKDISQASGALVLTPPIPAEIIRRLREVVAAFDAGTYRMIEEAIADPGGPDMRDVVADLYRLRKELQG